ncbi:MAG: ATP-binding protein [Haloferacaceae archaeon]
MNVGDLLDPGADTGPRAAAIDVLCVDDDPEFARLTAEYLEREGDAIRSSVETDPTVALDRLTGDADGFDGVVCDYDMPELTGLELLDALAERGRDLPFVLFTGKGSEEIASRAVSRGVTDYVQKDGSSETFAVVANRIEEAVTQDRAERRLRRRERQFRQLVRVAPSPITMYDESGEYVFANRAAAEFFGYESPAELIGKTKYDLLSPTEHGQVERRLSELAAGEDIPTSKHSYVTADGDRTVGIASCTPAAPLDAAGITVIRSVSDERGKAERLGDLARCLSHDLETPLDTVEGRVKLATETGDVSHLSGSTAALDRIRDYVDEVVELLRNEGRAPEFEPVDLSRACRRAWDAVAPGTASLSVSADRTIKADPTYLDRLLENLLGNAVEHGGEDVTVRVEAVPGGFRVADDGPGIRPEARNHVFDPGYTTSTDGTGFGLTSVKQVVLAHGWEVDLAESDDGGARFTVTGVDVVDEPARRTASAPSTEP